jgi:hypothetical protein
MRAAKRPSGKRAAPVARSAKYQGTAAEAARGRREEGIGFRVKGKE